ncbi:hypothetical protein NQP46_05745 [Streptomyces albus]|nr:hypothetical protein NQP46_05745 [Streptomyces albus]
MELLGKLNAWLRDGGGTAVSALAEVRAGLRACAAMQPRPDDWVALATLPVPLDEADVRLLAEAARELDRAVRDDPATLLHGDLGTAMERLRTPEALRPFVLAETPLEVRLSAPTSCSAGAAGRRTRSTSAPAWAACGSPTTTPASPASRCSTASSRPTATGR